MNAWEIKSEYHDRPPTLGGGDDVVLEPGWKPALRAGSVEVTRDGEGKTSVSIQARSKSEARRLGLDGELERLLGEPVSEELRARILEAVRQSVPQAEEVDPMLLELAFDFQRQYRSATHAALKALALYEPELARSGAFEPARRFARYDEGHWTDFAVTVTDVQYSLTEDLLRAGSSPLVNCAELFFSRATGEVVALVTVLGRIQRAVCLSSGVQRADRALLVFEEQGAGVVRALDSVLKPFVVPVVGGEVAALIDVGPAPAREELFLEAARLARLVLPLDVLSRSLGDGIEALVRVHPVLTAEALHAAETLFAEHATMYSRVHGHLLPSTEARALVVRSGLGGVATALVGRGSEDADVVNALGAALLETFREVERLANASGTNVKDEPASDDGLTDGPPSVPTAPSG